MTTEWRDLLTLQDVAAAIEAGDEIQVGNTRLGVPCNWYKWDGEGWSIGLDYRARPRQPKKLLVKSSCWRNNDDGSLVWANESIVVLSVPNWRRFQRFPAGDIEGEVEE